MELINKLVYVLSSFIFGTFVVKLTAKQISLNYKPGGLNVETNRDRDRERP